MGAASLGGALGAFTTVGPQIDVSKEDCYWREHYATRPYVPAGADYATGGRHTGMARACLSTASPRDWHGRAGVGAATAKLQRGLALAWEEAVPAVREAWDRVDAARE